MLSKFIFINKRSPTTIQKSRVARSIISPNLGSNTFSIPIFQKVLQKITHPPRLYLSQDALPSFAILSYYLIIGADIAGAYLARVLWQP